MVSDHTRAVSDERTALLEASPVKQTKPCWKDLHPYIRPLIASNFIALIAGLNDGNLGIIIPRLKIYYDISDATVSILFLCNALGFFMAAGCNGYLVHKFGQLNTIFLGAGAITGAYLILVQGLAFPIMCFCMMIQGGGVGLMDGAVNVFVANIPMATLMLNILHAIYGVGAMITPSISTALLAHNISWKGIYVFLLFVALVNIVLITIGFRNVDLEGKTSQTTTTSTDEQQDDKSVRRLAIFNRMTLLGALYILTYAGVEVCVGGWGYSYLTQGMNGNEIDMGYVISGYWAGLAVGRLILGWFTGTYGEKRMISIFTITAASLLLLIFLVPDIWLDSLFMILVGFFIGPMFPSCVSLASKVLPRNMHPTAIGFMSAFGAGGAAFFPFLAGQIAGFVGIIYMPLAWFTCAVVMQVIWTFIPNGKSKMLF
ncbi:major facilitator superfamily domain-containing protein [Halteromyces radiatus]|uniref:major facilitator superfamily domain-containing protein n=1 Tax=Halteromyces radiatus TaxID=101107 RepID=UPI002220D1F8|nr:major facilitator superfamily domain-containing protein [Halteromyces radiatus]KAI8093195.1 major facilitator superfamily domain-containing protein [Halteromyces radiatus]